MVSGLRADLHVVSNHPMRFLDQLHHPEQDALLAWLTAPPTTMVGVIATLEAFPAMVAAALRKIASS
jgi:hypothetical protein